MQKLKYQAPSFIINMGNFYHYSVKTIGFMRDRLSNDRN